VTVHDDGGTADGGVDTTMATFTVTVKPTADTPLVAGATTPEDTQTAAGIVITRNAADGAEVPYVKITGITNGALYLNDGATEIHNGDFIAFVQGGAGLKFTPAADFFGTASFNVQASTTTDDSGLGGVAVAATITVTPVADAPDGTGAVTLAERQTTSGLVI